MALAPGDEFAQKAAEYCVFVDNPGTLPDPTPDAPDPDDLNNPTSRPGRSVTAPSLNAPAHKAKDDEPDQ